MKKKYLYVIFSIFLLCSFLVSCDNKNDNVEKNDKVEDKTKGYKLSQLEKAMAINNAENVSPAFEHELIIGDSYNPIYGESRNKYKYKSEDENIFSINSNGKIIAINKGSAYLRVYEDNKIYALLKINVKEKDTIKPNADDTLFNEFEAKFNNYNNTDSVILNYSLDTNGEEAGMTLKLKTSPLYMEIDDLSKTHIIFKEENNSYYNYQINDQNKYYNKNYLGASVPNLTQYNELLNFNQYKDYDYKKIEINKKKENEYELKLDAIDALDSIKGLLGNNSFLDNNPNYILTLDFIFEENEIKVTYNISIHMIVSTETVDAIADTSVGINMDFKFENFEEFNLSSYQKLLPSTIDGVEELTEANSFYLKSFEKAYVYKHFEKGRYIVKAKDEYDTDYIEAKLYNDKKELVDAFDFKDSRYFDNIFNIEEEGNYYLELYDSISSDKEAIITKLDDVEEKETLKSSKGTIKSKYDYKIFEHNKTYQDELIKITNKKDKKLYLYLENAKSNSWLQFVKVDPNGILYINPSDDAKIVVVSSIDSYNYNDYESYKYDYDFDVEIIDASNGRDYDNLDYITDEYNKDYYLGCDLANIKFKVKALSYGKYEFFALNLLDNTEESIYVDDAKGKNNNYFILEKGEHEFSYIPYKFCHYQIKYKYTDISDKDVTIDLKHVTYKDEYTSKINDLKEIDLQTVKYHFELDKDEIIYCIDHRLYIYDEADNLINFPSENYRSSLYKLKKGKYYAIYKGRYSTFNLAIYDGDAKDAFDINNIEKLALNKEYILTKSEIESNYIILSYKPNNDITLDATCINTFLELLDSSKNNVEYKYLSSGELKLELKANETYYFIVGTESGSDITTITFKKI